MMKNKLKKIAMLLCAFMITLSSIGMSTTTSDAWGWKKTKVNVYKTQNNKYVSKGDLAYISKAIDSEVAEAKGSIRKIKQSTLLGLLGAKSPTSALRAYLENMLGISKNINNSINVINSGLNENNLKGLRAFDN